MNYFLFHNTALCSRNFEFIFRNYDYFSHNSEFKGLSHKCCFSVCQWPVYISQFCLSFNSESLIILNLHLTSVLFSLNSEFISHMKFFLRHLRIARNAKLRNVNEILICNCCNNLFLFLWQKQASIQHIFMTGAIADISIETLFMYLINWCYCFLTII